MKKPLVSIIIVNWNGCSVLERCLHSLAQQTYDNIEIIVVDNHSDDGSAEMVTTSFPAVELVQLDTNTGFAEGNNRALESVRGEYVLLLNNDTVVQKSFLSPLVNVLQKQEDVAVVQPLLLYRGNQHYTDGAVNSAGAYLTPTGFLYYPYYGKNIERKALKQSEVFSANGACMLVRKSVIDDIGLFDDTFFAYYEETDFCHRVLLNGHRIRFEPSSVVYHQGSVTSSGMDSEFVLFHSYKNRINSFLKNLGLQRLIMIGSIHIGAVFMLMMVYVVQRRFDAARAIMSAVAWNASTIRKTLRKRDMIQRRRKMSDSELFGSRMAHPPMRYYYYLVVGLEQYTE